MRGGAEEESDWFWGGVDFIISLNAPVAGNLVTQIKAMVTLIVKKALMRK